jgi:hypothetical protein
VSDQKTSISYSAKLAKTSLDPTHDFQNLSFFFALKKIENNINILKGQKIDLPFEHTKKEPKIFGGRVPPTSCKYYGFVK